MHPAKLLVDIDARLKTTADRVAWARDVCRKASYYARMGHAKAALGTVSAVRKEFGSEFEPEVACWLMIAEGVLHFFEARQADAYDRFRGAYGVAASFAAPLAKPTCAAWMAHIEFNENRFDTMRRFLAETISLAPPNDHQALGRASLVFADAYHFAGSFSKARPWYEKTRIHATEEGDRTMLSALMHNVAAFRASNVRLADAFGESNPKETKQALLEAASANNYDAAIGTASFTLLVPLLQAQLLGVERRYYDGLMILARLDESLLPRKLQPLVDLERAWCSVGLGLQAESTAFARKAASQSLEDLELDDRAYVLARIGQMEKLLEIELLPGSESLAAELFRKHREAQSKLERQLDELTEVVVAKK